MELPLLNERDLAFILYELLDCEALCQRDRYADHSRDVFNAVLETARTVANRYFANHNAKGDACEPRFDGKAVELIEETRAAWESFAQAGFLAAFDDYDRGGMQLPEPIFRSCMALFSAANIATTGYPFLSIGAANLIRSFGSRSQQEQFLAPMVEGRYAGTMALTEPGQGSALADIKTVAEPAADGSYRICGQKMFISGGDQSITENIVHMVLAKIKGAPAGVKGISLFIVPKFLVQDDGSMGPRNDVALAGLLHKMGYRNTTSTVLNFGEKDGAVGYLVGEPHQGLAYMFQMMNEARIGVGLGAAALAYQGYNASLSYARERPQGRLPSNKDPNSPQIRLIEHADVRRMLLAQKAFAEGGLALCLLASSLHEDQRTHPDASEQKRAGLLLDLLTPVVKSWPSKYGCVSNDLAIQIFGGSGYIREYPVEQLYRDQRLNPIHEGAEAIHGIDLLGRKVLVPDAFDVFAEAVHHDIALARQVAPCVELAEKLDGALSKLGETTRILIAELQKSPDRTLANATLYLDAFGRVVAAWTWLKQARVAAVALLPPDFNPGGSDFYRGKLQAARYYMNWELPAVDQQLALLQQSDAVPFEMRDEWF